MRILKKHISFVKICVDKRWKTQKFIYVLIVEEEFEEIFKKQAVTQDNSLNYLFYLSFQHFVIIKISRILHFQHHSIIVVLKHFERTTSQVVVV